MILTVFRWYNIQILQLSRFQVTPQKEVHMCINFKTVAVKMEDATTKKRLMKDRQCFTGGVTSNTSAETTFRREQYLPIEAQKTESS